MGNTFADHILGLAARGKAAESEQLVVKEPAAKAVESSSSDANQSSGAASGMTYASVVLLMGFGAATAATTAHSAVDGALAGGGATSSGRVGISLVIPERVEVAGMRSIALASDADGVVSGETAGCIFGQGAGQYSVSTLSSTGAAGSNYELAYSAGSQAPRVLTMGAALQRLEGAGASGCAKGVNNARIALRMKSGAVQAGGTAPLSGALTLLIAPE